MLWTIAVVLLILWALGFGPLASLGYFIHIFLVVALIIIVLQIVTGRRAP